MPVVLSDGMTTPYPVKTFNRVDPWRDYFVVRKNPNNTKVGNIGEIKFLEPTDDESNGTVVVSWLDTHTIDNYGSYTECDRILRNFMKDFDVIMITEDDISTGNGSGMVGHDSDRAFAHRLDIIKKMFSMVEDRLRNRRLP